MKHLTPQQAHDLLQANPNALLIDCRTEIEHYYVGHPVGAINIEWNTAPDFEVNPHFADEVLRMAGRKERPIVLICRSGKRPAPRSRRTVSPTSPTCSRASRANSIATITAAPSAAGAGTACPGGRSDAAAPLHVRRRRARPRPMVAPARARRAAWNSTLGSLACGQAPVDGDLELSFGRSGTPRQSLHSRMSAGS